MGRYFVHFNGAVVFVKEAAFFEQQRRENPKWDTSAWKGPIAADGVEHARMIGQQMVERGELK